jgi:hypothetical protein
LIQAYIHAILEANIDQFREVAKMSDAVIDRFLVETGVAARVEAATREENSREIARKMKADNEPLEKIIRYTGLEEDVVKNL